MANAVKRTSSAVWPVSLHTFNPIVTLGGSDSRQAPWHPNRSHWHLCAVQSKDCLKDSIFMVAYLQFCHEFGYIQLD